MKKKLIVFLTVFSLICTLGFPMLVTASGTSQSESTIAYETLPNSLSVALSQM